MKKEACNAIIASFPVLYPTSQTKTELLTSLISSNDEDAGMCFLRDLILKKFADELNSSSTSAGRKKLEKKPLKRFPPCGCNIDFSGRGGI